MNISSSNIILGYQSPFVSENSLSKELIEKFKLSEEDIENEPVRAYDLVYDKTSQYNSDGHEGHILLDANLVDKYFANKKIEKMSDTDIIKEVKYSPQTDNYYLEKTNPAHLERTFTITSKEPITNEYLKERYDQIQEHFHEKHQNDENQYDIYKGDPSSYDRTIELDGRTTIIDEEEYDAHLMIYAFTSIHEKPPTESLYTNWQYHNLLNIENKYENAPEFEKLVEKFTQTSINLSNVYTKLSLSVSLGLVDPGDQTYFANITDEYGTSFILKDIQNDTLTQAILDTINTSPGAGYFHNVIKDIFGGELDDDNLQSLLNDFAQRKNEDNSNNTSHSMFTFTGDITIDENSTKEYKNFITNNLIDFFKEQQSIFVQKELKKEFESYNETYSPKSLIGMKYTDFNSIAEFREFRGNDLDNDMSPIAEKYFDTLVNYLKKSIDKDAEENSNLLAQYTKNTKQNPLDSLEQ